MNCRTKGTSNLANNAKFTHQGTVEVRSKQQIRRGDEIFAAYGPKYWGKQTGHG